MRATRLLIIEDSHDVRLLLQIELERRGYVVSTAESAETALSLAEETRPSVIVSDLGLPGADGLEFLRRIRSDARLRDTPAIALSGFGERRMMKAAREAGYEAVLTKPVEIAELVKSIERVSRG